MGIYKNRQQERDELKEENDMLIYENKNFANFLEKYLELTQDQIDEIAHFGFTNLHRKEEDGTR